MEPPELPLLREDPLPEDRALGGGLELRDLDGALAAGAGELLLLEGLVALDGVDPEVWRERLEPE